MEAQVYLSAFKTWENVQALGRVRVSSSVSDKHGRLIYTDDYLMIRVPDELEELGYCQENYIVYIFNGKFMMRNLLTARSLPLYDYRNEVTVVGNAIEGPLKVIK